MALKTTDADLLRRVASELGPLLERLPGVADTIDNLDTFIRRDNGSVSIRDALNGIVSRFWGAGSEESKQLLVDELDAFTLKLRNTSVEYMTRQFCQGPRS